ncbi:MAG: hypothetical protein WCY92_02600 [Novosphingobium sp.]
MATIRGLPVLALIVIPDATAQIDEQHVSKHNPAKGECVMLQIIGLLGCVYLFVKAFDILGSANHRKANGSPSAFALVAVILALLGAILFAVILLGIGTAPTPYQP